MEIDRIYNEDCLIGMRDIPDKSIDLIIGGILLGFALGRQSVMMSERENVEIVK